MTQRALGRYSVRFVDVTVADASRKISDLRQDVLEAHPDVQVHIEKDPTTQDFGTTLVLILGTPAILAVAKGIADHLRRERAILRIEHDGAVLFQGSSADAARIAEALRASQRKE